MADIYHANLFYFRKISRIGGTEQFLYEMAKKYHKYDMAVLYDEADFDQLLRLRKLIPCIRRKRGQVYRAKKAFFNFNIDAIDQIQADEHIFVCHAIYQELGYKPPIDHPKITKVVGVSKYAVEQIKLQEKIQNVDKPIEMCYNPLTLEKPNKVMRLISACRLEDKTKGGERTLKLIDALDRYCAKSGKHYIWTIYTNNVDFEISSPNVALMRPRPDVRDYIADSDWLVQVSNNMETYCYSMNEALGYGVRVVRTPLTVCQEFKIPKQAELVLDWDCANVDDIVKRMFEPAKDFTYKPPKDAWERLLDKEPSNYTSKEQKVIVKAICAYYDVELGRNVSNWSPAWEVSVERARVLVDKQKVRVIESVV